MAHDEETPTLRDAEEAFEQGDFEGALDILEGMFPDDESDADPVVLHLAAECLLQLQEPQEAAHLIDAALEQAPDEGALLLTRAIASFELVELEDAQRFVDRAIAAEPELAEAWYYAGLLAERRGDAGDAKAAFERAVALAPDELLAPTDWSAAQVEAAVRTALSEVPDPLGAWMRALEIVVEDLPPDSELRTEEGAISPLVHCIFRGGSPSAPQGDDPAGWLGEPPAQVALFRKNLGKGATTEEELIDEVVQALIWECIEYLGLEHDHLDALGLEEADGEA